MLRAPANPPDRAASEHIEVQAAAAALRDVPRIAVGRTAGIAARRHRAVRGFVWPSVLTSTLTLTGQVGRGEVFIAGRGSSVVMTPTPVCRTSLDANVTVAVVYVLLVIVIPFSVLTIAATIGGDADVAGIVAAGAYLVLLVASALIAAGGPRRSRGAGTDPAAVALLACDGPVVRLHDLVRNPSDPAGTGVALLRKVIQDPRFGAATIITTAASSRLADAYQSAGMTVLPGSKTTLYRRPLAPQAGVEI